MYIISYKAYFSEQIRSRVCCMHPRGKISGKPAHARYRDLLRPVRWAAIAGTRVAARGIHGVFVRKHTPGRRLPEYRQELIPPCQSIFTNPESPPEKRSCC